mmetsp:Transcript_29529/g.71321  ORF Transcript_29529/g.71321 Transcript_29529/m.71321 type:complete len:225 (+) Transcript_29529:204-878(+)
MIISAEAATTGLSPLFHLADFKIGSAASFFLPPRPGLPAADLLSSNQSSNNHRSNARSLATFLVVGVGGGLDVSFSSTMVSFLTKVASDCWTVLLESDDDDDEEEDDDDLSSSKYAFTSPSFFDNASFVRLTGTTCSLHTHAATAHNTTMKPIPTNVSVDGITASYVVVGGAISVAPIYSDVEDDDIDATLSCTTNESNEDSEYDNNDGDDVEDRDPFIMKLEI